MPWWLAVRDHDAQKPIAVDDVDDAKMQDAYANARQKYPPPQYEVVLANAPNLEAFLKNYPRFQGAAPSDAGGGTSAGKTPTPSTPPPAKPGA